MTTPELFKAQAPISPYECGAADRYYGRRYNPHYEKFYPRFMRVEDLTADEVEEYTAGWNEETDRKDWGDGQYAYQQSDR